MDIFERCARWIMDEFREGWVVCHGVVIGDNQEDVYQHAWLELPDKNAALMLSTGKPIVVPADAYRTAHSAYTIDEYSRDQIRALTAKTKHFGPYDPDLKTMPKRILH